ncbi:hypothetical protein J4440_03445 [Candidatus Woesearchaeota archaeon]|nr:hypothetical protein [Candidatus Woesearchaeota archaeon]
MNNYIVKLNGNQPRLGIPYEQKCNIINYLNKNGTKVYEDRNLYPNVTYVYLLDGINILVNDKVEVLGNEKDQNKLEDIADTLVKDLNLFRAVRRLRTLYVAEIENGENSLQLLRKIKDNDENSIYPIAILKFDNDYLTNLIISEDRTTSTKDLDMNKTDEMVFVLMSYLNNPVNLFPESADSISNKAVKLLINNCPQQYPQNLLVKDLKVYYSIRNLDLNKNHENGRTGFSIRKLFKF